MHSAAARGSRCREGMRRGGEAARVRPAAARVPLRAPGQPSRRRAEQNDRPRGGVGLDRQRAGALHSAVSEPKTKWTVSTSQAPAQNEIPRCVVVFFFLRSGRSPPPPGTL